MKILYTNTIYKYGVININTIPTVFNNPLTNIQITNELCKNDPVYGELKYIYDKNNNIICEEYDYINIIPNNKFEGIDGIFWINLDRSSDRKKEFELKNKELFNLNIPTVRISAIDGKMDNLQELITNYNDIVKHNINNYEFACTLSHIKTLFEIKKYRGDYFLILEDDIHCDNLKYITNFKDIIQQCPEFDILRINKIYNQYVDSLYCKHDNQMFGTRAYIVNKRNINFLNNFVKYENNKFIFLDKNIYTADVHIYKYYNTFVYKYNIIEENCGDSTIHQHHVQGHIDSKNFNQSILTSSLKLGLIKELIKS